MSREIVSKSLRRLDPSELVAGLPLPDHVHDCDGRILIRAGQILTTTYLRLIELHAERGVYVRPDWSYPSCGAARDRLLAPIDEWQLARRRRQRPAGPRTRLRQQPRHAWRAPVNLVLHECCDGMIRRRQVTATACDLSAAGFAFTCPHFVHVGTVVYTRFTSLPERPVTKGVVRNCVHLEGRTHRVGVEFVPFDRGETPPPGL